MTELKLLYKYNKMRFTPKDQFENISLISLYVVICQYTVRELSVL